MAAPAGSLVRQNWGKERFRWLSFPLAIGALQVIVVLAFALPSISEPDIWWHLRNGAQIVTEHALPRFDHYSFTAAGAPWIAHEWLSEAAFFLAYRAGGLRGVVVLYSVLALFIFEGLYLLCCRQGGNPKTAAVVALGGMFIGSVSFGPRMLLFGWLCMVILLLLLHDFGAGRARSLCFVPPLFCLWINLHGSWLFGLIVSGMFVAGGLIAGEWGLIYAARWTARQVRQLLITAGAAVVALFINPFGYKLVAYPFDVLLRQQTNIKNIGEWQSVDFHEPRGKLMMVFVLAIFSLLLLSRRRWRLSDAALGLFALYSSLMYWRMQFFAALIFVPLVAARMELFPPYDEQKEKPLLNALIIAGSLLAVWIWFPTTAALTKNIEGHYPEAALQHMQKNGITERVFEEYLWGGYTIWRAPQIKTFIDGRADLFVYNGVFDDYLHIMRLENSFELLDKYRIQYALLAHDGPQAYVLAHHNCWRKLYSDNVAVLFQRDAAACPLASSTTAQR